MLWRSWQAIQWKEPLLDFLGLRVPLGDLLLILGYFTMLSLGVPVCAVDMHEGHLSASLCRFALLGAKLMELLIEDQICVFGDLAEREFEWGPSKRKQNYTVLGSWAEPSKAPI